MCGNALSEKHGDYIHESPNGSVTPIRIPNASWSICENCGERVLPKSLAKAIKRNVMKLDQ
jgi:hypothetical protein